MPRKTNALLDSFGTLKPHQPSLRERGVNALREALFSDDRAGQGQAENLMGYLDYTPVGAATAMYDAGRLGAEGDYLGAGLNTAMAAFPAKGSLRAFHGSFQKGLKNKLSTRKAIETENALFAASNPDVAETFTVPREYGEPMYYDEAGNEIEPGEILNLTLDPRNPYEVPADQAQKFIDDTTFQGQVMRDARGRGHDMVAARNVLEGIGERYPGDVYGVLDDSVINYFPEQLGPEGLPLFGAARKPGPSKRTKE